MTVKDLIALLQTMPQDAIVISTMSSDYAELEPADFCLFRGREDYESKGAGLIRHHGHLMHLEKKWWPQGKGEKPASPEFVTAFHIAGN